MEIEIELIVTLPLHLAQRVQESLGANLHLVALRTSDRFSLRPTEVLGTDITIDVAVKKYLDLIEPIAPLLGQGGRVLRVGAFFSEGEAAAFSVLLSDKTVLALARHGLEIDVTCYPCS